MQKAMCKLCGARHNRYEPHAFAEGTKLIPLSAEMSYDSKRGPGVAVILPQEEVMPDPHPPHVHNVRTWPTREELKLLSDETLMRVHNAYRAEVVRRQRAKAKESKE